MRKRHIKNNNDGESDIRPPYFGRKHSLEASKSSLVLPPIVSSTPKHDADMELESLGDRDSVFEMEEEGIGSYLNLFKMC